MSQETPVKTYRLTWNELMRRHREIAPNAILEVQVYEPETAMPQTDEENQALVDLLRSWREEDATDDTQELERRDEETNALMTNLHSSRLSLRIPEVE